MRLISQQHSKYKGKKYYKHWIVIPQRVIEKLGWRKGEKLGSIVKDKRLIIETEN